MKVVIIGRGNVATQFASIFGATMVNPHTLDGLVSDADLYIIAVSDSAVDDIIRRLPKLAGVVVHTTGSLAMEVLSHSGFKRFGVLYPFQTISKKRPLLPSAIPLLIEANDLDTEEFLLSAARQAGFSSLSLADSETRRRIHLSATFACNFTNAMISISQKLLAQCGIDPEIVMPLITETFEKLKCIPAIEAQTGPALRRDFSTMQKHLSLLDQLGLEMEAKIYSDVSDFIMSLHSSPRR